MYKMVLVDDEKYVIKGLKDSINWKDQDIQIVGEASNGLSAYKLIKDTKPDIVITDIYMPKMGGLELIEKTLDILPHTKIIILSGFEDFEYAQTAIRKKAFDYILKPIEKDKIVDIIKKAKDQIAKELDNIKNMINLKKQLQESLPTLREKYLKHLLEGTLSLNNILEEYNYLNINLQKRNFVIMVIEIDDDQEGRCEELITLGIKNIIKDSINEVYQGEVVDEYFKKIVIILNYDKCEKTNIVIEKLEKIGKKIKSSTEKSFDKSLTIGIGRLYEKADYIMDSYKEALEALEYKLFLGKGQIIFYNDVAVKKNNPPVVYPFSKENKIITALNLGDTDNISDYVIDFINFYTKKNNASPEYLKRACLQLIYIILRKLAEWDISLEIVESQEAMVSNRIKALNSCSELQEYLTKFFKGIAYHIKDNKHKSNRSTIENACYFIKKNYYKDISLIDIANYVNLTRTYFASLFKRETGRTVMGYLKEIRINKAKDLLQESNFKIYEVAEKVGYNNSNYFAKVFREHSGVSPNEYRNL